MHEETDVGPAQGHQKFISLTGWRASAERKESCSGSSLECDRRADVARLTEKKKLALGLMDNESKRQLPRINPFSIRLTIH